MANFSSEFPLSEDHSDGVSEESSDNSLRLFSSGRGFRSDMNGSGVDLNDSSFNVHSAYDPNDNVENDSIFDPNMSYSVPQNNTKSSYDNRLPYNQDTSNNNALFDSLVSFLKRRTSTLSEMCASNLSSFYVEYSHIESEIPLASPFLVRGTAHLLQIFDKALAYVVKKLFPAYSLIAPSLRVRLVGVPLTCDIASLRREHVGSLLRVSGVVSRRSLPVPVLQTASLSCARCFCSFDSSQVVARCPSCAFFGKHAVIGSRCVYEDSQIIVLQQHPSSVRPARIPRSVDVCLRGDLVGLLKPGDSTDITGILQSENKLESRARGAARGRNKGVPIFHTVLHAISQEIGSGTCNLRQKNDLDSKEDNQVAKTINQSFNCENPALRVTAGFISGKFFESQVSMLLTLARRPDIVDLLAESLAPGIYGHTGAKKALILALLGGTTQSSSGVGHSIVPGSRSGNQGESWNGMIQNHGRNPSQSARSLALDSAQGRSQGKARGDIHVLLVGDPGTAKSALLRAASAAAQRCVLATGRGASSVGLTASVRLDSATKQYVLEGGALVLADRGIAAIDEFDKMEPSDRAAIHEAMEQQSVSIAKAGIVAQLHARCGVLAAANPRKGVYDPQLSFSRNVNLSDPIVSRFDIIVVMMDHPGSHDTHTARHVLETHRRLTGQPIDFSDNTDFIDAMEGLNAQNNHISTEETHSETQCTGSRYSPRTSLNYPTDLAHPSYAENLDHLNSFTEKENVDRTNKNTCHAQNFDENFSKGTSHGISNETQPKRQKTYNSTKNASLNEANINLFETRTIPHHILKMYLAYARENFHPVIHTIDREKISRLYADLRKESSTGGNAPITARTIESIIRMSQAYAKARLRKHVHQEDIDQAIQTAIESFLQLQRAGTQKVLRNKLKKYLATTSDALLHILDNVMQEKLITGTAEVVSIGTFEERVRRAGMVMKSEFYKSTVFCKSIYTLKENKILKRSEIL